MSGALFDVSGDGAVVLRVVAHPGAGRDAVVGRHGDALRVKVAAPPVGGRANDACAALVARLFGVGAGDVELTAGRASRSKRFRVRGVTPEDASRILEALLAGVGGPGGGNT